MEKKEIGFQCEQMRKDGYDGFISNPMTRMGISFIPASDHPETLQMLLRAAYDAGFNTGQAAFGISMLEGLMKEDRKRS